MLAPRKTCVSIHHYLWHHDTSLHNHYAQRMRERSYYTYIVASRTRVLYIGVTGDIERRMLEHKSGTVEGFTAMYRCKRLVWFERYDSPTAAIAREKQLKGWLRAKKTRPHRAPKPYMDRPQRKLGQTHSSTNAVILSEQSKSKDLHSRSDQHSAYSIIIKPNFGWLGWMVAHSSSFRLEWGTSVGSPGILLTWGSRFCLSSPPQPN